MRRVAPFDARDYYYYYFAETRGCRAPAVFGGGFDPISLAPLAWWGLDDGSGAAAVDSSGNGYDLTLANEPTWIAGHIGGGLTFDGVDQKGETSAAGLLAALQGISALTVAFWARAAGNQADAAAFMIRNGGGTSGGDLLLVYPYDTAGGGHGARVYWGGNIIDEDDGAAFREGWNHYALVSRGETDHELYVNNVSVGTSIAGKLLSETLTHVGIGAWNGGQFFAGDMDNVLLFDRALTAGELTQLYTWTG